MNPGTAILAFLAGVAVAVLSTPVGVSGAIFLLPVQLDVLHVPNPAVTPTNLLFNVIAAPGALLRLHRTGAVSGPLTRRLLLGTLPGVVLGTVIRVFVAPGESIFRLLAAAVLLPIGVTLCARRRQRRKAPRGIQPATITVLGVAAGVVGGIYGIGGGSLLGPVLVGSGLPVATVAPAALVATFVTSVVGVTSYGVLSLSTGAAVGPVWPVGILCGLGGLAGGYLGVRIQSRLPEAVLRLLLGALAVVLGLTYVAQVISG